MNETRAQRLQRLHDVIEATVVDCAFYEVARQLDHDPEAYRVQAYGRLECLGSRDLAEALVLALYAAERPQNGAVALLDGLLEVAE